MSTSVRLWMVCSLVSICLGSWASVARADARDSYRRGLQALERGEHREAARLMEEAIEQRSEERARLPRYTPHFFLAAIRYELDDCRAALEALRVSEQQGVIQKTKSFEELRRIKNECTSRIADVAQARQAVARAEQEYRNVAATLESLGSRPELQQDWNTGERSFAQRQDSSAATLATALAAADRAERELDVAGLQQATRTIDQARGVLTQIIGDARRQLDEMSLALSGALEQLEAASQLARRRLSAARQLEPYPQQLETTVAQVRSVLAQADRDKGSASEAELVGLTETVTRASSRLQRAARRPPAHLLEAASLYLDQNYPSVLALLTTRDDSSDSAKVRAHSQLLMAAAEYALFRLDGELDHDLLESSRQRILETRELDADLTVDDSVFSPSFLIHFRTISETQSQEEKKEDGEGGEGPLENG